MVFKVLLHPNAVRDFRKLDSVNKGRMKNVLLDLAKDSWNAGKPLHPSDFWTVRAGDYRAVYEINPDKNQVVVLFVGHRKRVYDDFSKLL